MRGNLGLFEFLAAGLSDFWSSDISRRFGPHFCFRRCQLEHETGLYKILVLILGLVSVPLSGSGLELDVFSISFVRNSVLSALGFKVEFDSFLGVFKARRLCQVFSSLDMTFNQLLQNYFDMVNFFETSWTQIYGLLFRKSRYVGFRQLSLWCGISND
ncbi:unnamed protein product [Rhizophagus irregularis]|uniref:Uncharacterized protein n=1 Tax=Rhizophagus irregularis TaxID=588596 RepID=A0A2I1HK40_9GLOM|nr:hypothetical protein RhiirA4_481810 [Rhizophagus irregularis]CAB4416174.1 unnamed protein product [Rhizophagus irregularis]